MEGITILVVIVLYFSVLFLLSYWIGRRYTNNEAFFLGNRKSPWYIVTIGMLGDSISGVTFLSVPGMVGQFDMTYMQMVLGFFPGYLLVAFILLPLYYRLNLVSIYGYLDKRFGTYSYKTGSVFFILSRIIGSAAKLYLVVLVLQSLVFNQWGIPLHLTVIGVIFLIWLYTFRSGMKAIVWTDALQTIFLLVALLLIIWQVVVRLDINVTEAVSIIKESEHSRIFVFDDWASKQNFFKQFLSGVFIVLVMTGLDQNMMQKNISCRNVKDAQKNMICYGFGFIPLNLLFLSLGVLLLVFASQYGISLSNNSDEILPLLATQYLGLPVIIFFTIGMVAASFSNADSAMVSITTSICVDLLATESKEPKRAKRIRTLVHLLVGVLLIVAVLLIDTGNKSNILDVIYTFASYTYGPLLGLYFVGLSTGLIPKDKYVPIVCLSAPVLCYLLKGHLLKSYNYEVGYEMLLINAVLTGIGLWIISCRCGKITE